MFRSVLNFLSKEATTASPTESVSLLRIKPKQTANSDLAKLIAQDVEAYLAQRNSAQAKLGRRETTKTVAQLLSDFKIQNTIYLQKKKAFKQQTDKDSNEYKALRKEYLEATHAAYRAINLWMEQERVELRANHEAAKPCLTSPSPK